MESNARARAKMVKFLVMTLLVVAFPGLSCCTMAVQKMRKDRETEIARVAQFRSIVDVRSGWIAKDGTAWACTEFKDGPEARAAEMAIRVSDARIIGQTYSTFNPTPPRLVDPQGVTLYFYPMQYSEKNCEPPPNSAKFSIHSLQLPANEQDRIADMIRSPEVDDYRSPALFKIFFTLDSSASAPKAAGVLLVFRPSSEASNPEPFGIPGGFEPGSELVNPYTLLLAPAAVLDAAVILLVIGAMSIGYGR